MTCQLINNGFSILIHFILGIFALFSLGVKRITEKPRRPLKIFIYDVSKQVIGALYAHGLNILIAVHVTNFNNNNSNDNDQCMWYFVNFIVDVFIGLTFNWLFLKLINYLAIKYKYNTLISGKYQLSEYYCNLSYCLQLVIWLLIITIVKLILFFAILVPFSNELEKMGTSILSPISNHEEIELIIVMIVVPFSLNILQFWLQDTFLKDNTIKIENPNIIDPTLSPDISPTHSGGCSSREDSYLEIKDLYVNNISQIRMEKEIDKTNNHAYNSL